MKEVTFYWSREIDSTDFVVKGDSKDPTPTFQYMTPKEAPDVIFYLKQKWCLCQINRIIT